MTFYDWLVIGSGITGAALAYELQKETQRVLLLDQRKKPANATAYSYGGLAYWSGTSDLTRQLCQEGILIQRHLSQELNSDTGFRELDLLLMVNRDQDPEQIAGNYAHFAMPPQIVSIAEACQIEPFLNPEAISGALIFPHAQVHPLKIIQAYQQAFFRLGGKFAVAQVISFLGQGNQIQGVKTEQKDYYAANTVVCAGGLSRKLLQQAGITTKLYFTHSQVIVTPPVNLKLNTQVMPAMMQRFTLENEAKIDSFWQGETRQSLPAIIDPGAIQLEDGSLRLGQISQIITDPDAKVNLRENESLIRGEIAKILPSLANIPGTCQHCLVAYAPNNLPLIGNITDWTGIYLFSGFTSTFVLAPALAPHFVDWAINGNNQIIPQLRRINPI